MKQSASAWSFGKEKARKVDKTSNLATPGPGSYNNTPLISGKGKIFNSKYSSSPSKTMSGRFNPPKQFSSKQF